MLTFLIDFENIIARMPNNCFKKSPFFKHFKEYGKECLMERRTRTKELGGMLLNLSNG